MANPLYWPFDTAGFVPRWQCGDWSPILGWLHIISDLLIWFAYLAIPILLIYFVRRRKDLPFSKLFWLFGAFIVSCGTTHLLEAIIFWEPAYRLLAIVKVVTAIASLATVAALVPVIPRALALRSPQALEREVAARTTELMEANSSLRREVAERLRAETELRLQREWFEVVLSSIGDGVVAASPDRKITFLNPAAEELTGWSTSEAIGQPIEQVVRKSDEDTGEAMETLVVRVLRERAAVERSNHTLLTARNGKQRVIDRSAAPIRDLTGSVRGVVLAFRDTSEQKKAEVALRVSEERFRLIVESVKDYAIFMLNPTGLITTWNIGAERVLGYTTEEIIGQPFSRFFTPEAIAAEKPKHELEHATLHGSFGESDWRVRKDGSRFWASGVLTALYQNGTNELRGFVKISRDLTQRHRSEVLLRAVLDHALNAFISIDERGTIESFNTAAIRAFGYSESEVLGQNIKLLMPEPYHSEHDDYLANYLQTGIAHIIGVGREVRCRRKDGSTFPAHLTVKEFRLEEDQKRHFIGIIRDLTREKEGEEHRNRLVAVLEATPDFVGIFDAEGRPLFVNRAGLAMMGFTTTMELAQLRMDDIYPADTAKFLREIGLPKAIQSGTWMAETRLRARSGQEIPVSQVLVAHKTETGEVNFLSTIMRDLTAQNKLEEQFRQSQKMEAIGILAGGIAHDFNNILTIILGYGELLLERMKPTDPSRELIEEMTKAGERAAGLTRQLLAFSRQSVLGLQQLDLNVVVTELQKMLCRVIGEDVELVTQLQLDIGRIKADPGQLDQILMNLAVNARDAMPQGGRLTIATKNVVLGPADLPATGEIEPGPYVLLTISDTGHGMTQEVRARIFEPFFTTKDKGKGTGLGLAMAYGAVRQNRGFIEVDSAPGEGTTFRICLPESKEAPRSESSGPQLPRPIGGETILLVEDESGVRTLARLILETAGYRVLEASGGSEALELAMGHKDAIHLIITDVVMPGEGGRIVAERVLEQHPGAKVLYLSGYMDDAVVRHGILTESMNFLAKPFTPDGLSRRVREVLDAG